MKTTKTGFKFNPNKPFYCYAIRRVINSTKFEMIPLKYVSHSEPTFHHNLEECCDFIVEDDFGLTHEISEEFIFQR